jgi:hypothetical protein
MRRWKWWLNGWWDQPPTTLLPTLLIPFHHCIPHTLCTIHRNQTISRKGANIISRRPSHGHLARRCCPQAFLRIFSEVTYIRAVGNSTLLKIYTLPSHTIAIGVCNLETQLLGLVYGGGASFVQKWSMPWMSANIEVHFLYSLISMAPSLITIGCQVPPH